MEKKTEKEVSVKSCVTYGFWAMIFLFVAMMIFSFLKLQWPSMIAGILFIISIFFVFVSSIKAIVPKDMSMAYIALGIAILFILYVLLSATVGVSSGVLG